MASVVVKVHRMGDSLGFLIPGEVIKSERIKEDDVLNVTIMPTSRKIWGLIPNWKIDTQKAKDEARNGWD